MPRLELFLFGPPYLQREGVYLHIGRKKVLGLMAYLSITRRVHQKNNLARLFWPNKDDYQASVELRRALSILGQVWGWECLEITRETLYIRPWGIPWVDVVEFMRKINAWKNHVHSPNQECKQCLSSLTTTLPLYRNDFMTGFSLIKVPDFEFWQE